MRARIFAIGVTSAVVVVVMACGGGSGGGGGGGTKDVSKKTSSAPSAQTAAQSPADTATAAAPADEGPIMDGDHTVIRSEAVGPLRIGEWRRPVMSFVYAISARAGRDSTDIIVVHGVGKDTATLTFQNDTLRKIFVTHVGPHTVDGIGVGSQFADVANAPGASVAVRGGAKVATLEKLCGVQFSTDSLAIGQDSVASKTKWDQTIIRAISVGYCK